MLRSKVVCFLPIVLVSISILVYQITDQRASRRSASTRQAQSQNAQPTLNEAAITNSNQTEARDQARLRIDASYGNLPLSFEPNRGQTDPRVKFLSRAGNRTLWLTNDEAVLAVARQSRPIMPDQNRAMAAEGAPRTEQTAPAVLRMKFVGANAHPRIAGEAKQSGTVNYFAGKPNEWRTKIPTYARVRYRNLYPGIDLVFYGNNRELEYDLVVSPGADPGRIRLEISGAENLHLDAEGNLVLKTAAGEVIQQKPRIYQRKGTSLVAVAGDYVINNKDEVGFRLGSYDRRGAVVIDPVLRYSTFLGGSDFDRGAAIAVDSSNRAVVTGFTCSQDFPTTGGSTPPSPGSCSGFVTKIDFSGSHLVFSTFIANTDPMGVAVGSSGNIYITGQAFSGFPTTSGAFQTKFGGGPDGFVTKLNSTGTAMLYSTLLGGSASDSGAGVAVDPSGNAYVTGATNSTDFPTTPGVFQRDCALQSATSCANAFVAKLNTNGSRLLYSTFLGGHRFQLGSGIAVNQDGNAFVVGHTSAGDFPTTAGSAQPVFGGNEDAFVSEVSSSGSHLVYSTFLGGANLDDARGIALDAAGNAYVAGSTASENFPVKNAFQLRCTIPFCTFVTKLNRSGRLVYSTHLGGGAVGTSIAVTLDGQAYVTGSTSLTTFPTTSTAFQRVVAGTADIFLTKFSPTGKLIYSSFLGGNGKDQNSAVALDRSTNAYVTGLVDFETPGPTHTFPVTPGAFQQKPGGVGDAFVAKVVALCALSTVNRTVTICAPGNGSTVASPVRIIAGTTDVTPVKLTQIYLDGKKIFEAPLSAINVALPITGGTHRLTVQGLDTASVFFKKSISVTVSPH